MTTYDPACRYCQGTGMTTLNPDEEPGSHICEPAISADEERLTAAIGYDPVLVSPVGGGGGWTYRTVQDRDWLIERLLPLLAEVRAEAWAEGYDRASQINEGFHDVERHNPYRGGAS